MANRKIPTTELDFDAIKASLKAFLQNQSEYTDYNFDGAGLNIFLDVLAYNTHYNALYHNLAVNESFIDSASKRASVVSIAKELGYTPRSARCSEAKVNLSFPKGGVNYPVLTLRKGTPFTASVNGNQYTFYTVEDYNASLINGFYNFTNVLIKEGIPLTYRYSVADGQRYVIPNPAVDLSTLEVRVQESATSSTYTSYQKGVDVLNLTSESQVYFVKEIDNQQYEIEFGNGVIGKALEPGNIVHITYMSCSKDLPNSARYFAYNGFNMTGQMPTVTTSMTAVNGSDAENIESIRWTAPKYYASQNRCVTSDDYRVLIQANYPNAQAVNVWGGEDNSPPQYGKVFICVKPVESEYLSEVEKNYIVDTIVKPRKPLTITPVMVDPTYIKIQLDVAFYFNPQLTSRSSGELQTAVLQTIANYNNTFLNSFDGVFKFSRLSSLIDSTEQSITSNIITIKLHRDIEPIYGVVANYIIDLGNPIYDSGVPEESILSTNFFTVDGPTLTTPCYIDDLPDENSGSGTGVLRLCYTNSSGVKVVIKNVGTVNYTTGKISITDLNIYRLQGTLFTLTIKPQSNDVVSVRQQIVEIDPTRTTVTPIVDTTARSYKFTSSRN